ncbi:MAG: iron chaperone [Candidatus Thorarchaeota archaeon]
MKEGMPKKTTATSVDYYLANIPENARGALESLRKIIKEVVPDADEVISYQIPTFRYKGRMLVAYAAWKNHISLYVMSLSVMDTFRGELKSFDIEKSTIHFSFEQPLPSALVNEIVNARIKENEARSKSRK